MKLGVIQERAHEGETESQMGCNLKRLEREREFNSEALT